MLNKFLCRIWGHAWVSVVEFITRPTKSGFLPPQNLTFELYVRKIKQCKHCGARYD